MKLKNLEVSNFRCFDSLSMELDEQLTVLVAKNGQGKSSVLDAVRIGLWAFVRGFDLARNPSNETGSNISIDDVRMLRISDTEMARQLPCKITLQADLDINLTDPDRKTRKWTRYRDSEAKGTKTKQNAPALSLNIFAQKVQDHIRSINGYHTSSSVIRYFGTERYFNQKAVSATKSPESSDKYYNFVLSLSAYRDCFYSSSSYKNFAEWFIWVFECYREQQINDQEKGISEGKSVWQDTIQVVQEAINTVLHETGWHSLEYSVIYGKTLILKHNEQGILKVEQLSDGIRGVLAMVGDIAYRCIKLNPHLGLNAAKESRGVVMIDEIELHLHPAWQQTILVDLCKAFPKIQFIVTTHSPQVISTVPGHQIRILSDNQVYSGEAGTQGAEASRILKEVFGVELRAQHLEIVQKLNRYLELVDEDKWDIEEALTLRQTLNEWSKGHEPELIKVDIDIRMKEFQRQS